MPMSQVLLFKKFNAVLKVSTFTIVVFFINIVVEVIRLSHNNYIKNNVTCDVKNMNSFHSSNINSIKCMNIIRVVKT